MPAFRDELDAFHFADRMHREKYGQGKSWCGKVKRKGLLLGAGMGENRFAQKREQGKDTIQQGEQA